MSLKYSDEFKRNAVRIALTSGLTRRQVASDLSIGLSTLGKWIALISYETRIPTQDTNLLRENKRLSKEDRILRVEREIFKRQQYFSQHKSREISVYYRLPWLSLIITHMSFDGRNR